MIDTLVWLWLVLTQWGLVEWAAISQVLAAVFTGWAAWEAKRSVQGSTRAEQLQIFLEFSTRYDELKSHIPMALLQQTGATARRLYVNKKNMGRLGPDLSAVIALTRLFERQYFMYNKNMLDKDVWHIWESGILKHMRMPVFSILLAGMKTDFYPPFVAWLKQRRVEV